MFLQKLLQKNGQGKDTASDAQREVRGAAGGSRPLPIAMILFGLGQIKESGEELLG